LDGCICRSIDSDFNILKDLSDKRKLKSLKLNHSLALDLSIKADQTGSEITMKATNLLIMTALVFAGIQAHASADDAQVIAKLKDSKISLLDGIAQAEKTSGPVTSAKFEMDDGGNLSLSIYTAPQGLNTPAETNELSELSGDPTVAPFAPKAEIFADKEHIARASVHLTLMQLSRLTLSQIIREALNAQPGIPYSVANPMVRNGQPVADVFIADRHGQSKLVTVNMRSGAVVR
jgi:hypothetical protein